MATSIAAAKSRYARRVPVMSTNYQQSLERFFGVGTGALSRAIPVVNYKDAIKPGVEEKWERNLKNAFGL